MSDCSGYTNMVDETEPVKLRPNVAKHIEYFCRKVTEHGPDMVRGVLSSKDGRYKGGRLRFKLSNKDRYQLLQALGLLDKEVGDAPEQ